MNKQLLSGNEAIARGAIEAGISLAAAYPGTPSTEILHILSRDFGGHAEWAVNEKVAFETTVGVSFTGRRSLCCMKHVGLNVAADPLMTSAYIGTMGGLVLVVADDPGAYSSQNEQDSRLFARFAKIPCLEPADAEEAKNMILTAFDLSETFELPVMVRTLTRVAHAASPVTIGTPRPENPLKVHKNPQRMIAVPSNIVRLHGILNRKQPEIRRWITDSGFNAVENAGKKKGIIACGIAYMYAKEYGHDFSVFRISAYPFDETVIRDFVAPLEEVWVMEEGEPYVEEIARKYSSVVKGKMSGEFPSEGELGPDAFAQYAEGRTAAPAPVLAPLNLPPRPPVMCPGCPHRELYKSLKAAGPSFTAGDIGCYTLGASPPLRALDTCLCMGASISKAAGIEKQGVKKVAAVIGDSTFLHSGVTALISAVYNNANIVVIIMDNESVAMTGHQPTPLLGITAKGHEGGKVILEDLCNACGAASVTVIDPFRHEATEKVLREKLDAPGVNVVISRRPCILVGKKRKKD